ncbi:MAG: FAD-linked oxidase C-terminal domain-containing protein [Xanthomonadaceae bacterium]|nr:FAD-linked oxidase C-terminal domain-containing protein [Xanthomonadaceae bacterium]
MTRDLPTALIARLGEILGPDALFTDPGERLAYGYDNSNHRSMPGAVALPAEAAQVRDIVLACRSHGCPIVARGRGTNTTGASVPSSGGLVIGFERMNRLLELNLADRLAVVQPGLLNGDLQRAAGTKGLFWGPDPTSSAFSSIGGNLGCNSGGPRAVKYGACRDNVLGLLAVTGAGQLIRCGGPTTKASAGYDFTRFIIGSEGTLALIVEATLLLRPLPPARQTLRALYSDVAAAASAVARLMAQPHTPSMLEFMDGDCVRLAREVGGAEIPEAGALLMIEADGDQSTLDAAMAAMEKAASGPGLIALERARDADQREVLFAARKALSPALRTLAPGKINEDVVVPVSRIPDLVSGAQALAREFALTIVNFGHAGNGNLHVNILYQTDDAAEVARAESVLPRLFELALSLGGTLSGEHGIGIDKRDYMARAHGAESLALMRAVKAQFDPDGILNPGKLLPAPGSAADA